MTLLHPWALVGLLALPVLWWLHRRLARPPRVDVPSLLFFVEEPGPLLAAHRRRRDVDLLLAVLAAGAFAFAATGPVFASAKTGRLVRVVVAGGAPAQQTNYRARVEAEIERIRGALTSADELVVVRGSEDGPRPSFSALAARALAGAPGLAIVISDVLPPEPPPDVRWVAVGDPRVANMGIVAADLEPAPDGFRLLVSVLNHSRALATPVLQVVGDRVALDLAPGEVRAVVRFLPRTTSIVTASLDLTDALALDDRVEIRRDPPHWAIDARLPQAHREAASAALEAVLGVPVPTGLPGALPDVERWITAEAGIRVERSADVFLAVVPEDAPGIRAPAGIDRTTDETLSSAGLDLVYGGAPTADDDEEVRALVSDRRVWREAGGKTWPVVTDSRWGTSVSIDITRGSPAPAQTPFWPLLIDALVREQSGDAGVAGARRIGLLDPASTRLGRVAQPFDPAWLLAVPERAAPKERRLMPWLAALGLATLGVLWLKRARPLPRPTPVAG